MMLRLKKRNASESIVSIVLLTAVVTAIFGAVLIFTNDDITESFENTNRVIDISTKKSGEVWVVLSTEKRNNSYEIEIKNIGPISIDIIHVASSTNSSINFQVTSLDNKDLSKSIPRSQTGIVKIPDIGSTDVVIVTGGGSTIRIDT